jgi:hypothetical protein
MTTKRRFPRTPVAAPKPMPVPPNLREQIVQDCADARCLLKDRRLIDQHGEWLHGQRFKPEDLQTSKQ